MDLYFSAGIHTILVSHSKKRFQLTVISQLIKGYNQPFQILVRHIATVDIH